MRGPSLPRTADRRDAMAADEADPLASFRDRFRLPEGLVYLDGNSLGPPSAPVKQALGAIVEEWERSLVSGWDRWIDLPTRVGDRLGETLLGAARGQVVVADSTTVNLYKTVGAALDARPGRSTVVIEAGSFPTDRYIVQRLAADRGARVRVTGPDLDGALDDDVSLAVFAAVDYRTAALADFEATGRAAREVGALVLWDLSHAVGAVPLRLDEWGVDLAVGCSYKYLNAGPGAPAYLYVARALQASLTQPIPGWFAHVDQFAMEPDFRPADGMARFLTGTPNIPGTVAVAAGVEVLVEAGIDRLRAKSVALAELAIARADEVLATLDFEVASPRDARRRGSHVALRHPAAEVVCATLARDHSVVLDHRPPDIIRVGLAPLYTRYVDVWDAIEAMDHVGRGLSR